LSVERETKLRVGPGFQLPGFDGVRSGVRAVRTEPQRTRTVYWDTEDLRLARWGCSLRFRAGQAWTLKLPAQEDAGALSRDEIEAAGSPTTPPPKLVDLVTAYLRGAPVRPAVALQTVRTRVAFTDADRALLGEVVDDEVAVLDGRRIAARFHEVEVETHDDDLAGAAIARLRAAGAGETVLTPQYIRALGARALAPPELIGREELPGDAPVRDVVANALAVSVIRLLRADAGVRLDEDIEALHAARVAVRRLRSDLRTFRSLLLPGWSEPLRAELAWLGDALRAVRDLDVLSDRMVHEVDDVLGPADAEGGRRLVRRVRDERSAARASLTVDLGSPRYTSLLDRLVDAAAAPGLAPGMAGMPASEVAADLMRGPWSHLERACGRIRKDSPDEDLHAARIRAKRARYAAEALAPLAGRPATRFARAAADLQDVLGMHQDAVVTTGWLRGAAAAEPGAGFAAGLLAARALRERRKSRERWRASWKALRRRKRSWP
jgi:CHAD domain-containing protein